MPATHHHDARKGLLHSLASTLEPSPATRQARRRIEGASTRADDLDALLADLLNAADLAGYPDDNCIDTDFDDL
jgi:hypothetical protein